MYVLGQRGVENGEFDESSTFLNHSSLKHNLGKYGPTQYFDWHQELQTKALVIGAHFLAHFSVLLTSSWAPV